jgi:hypothetical protein
MFKSQLEHESEKVRKKLLEQIMNTPPPPKQTVLDILGVPIEEYIEKLNLAIKAADRKTTVRRF